MPNTAIVAGYSMTCFCSNVPGKKRIGLAEAMFSWVGHTPQIPEANFW